MKPIDPKLFATMERSALDGTLAGLQINLVPGSVAAVLMLDPVAMDAITLPLARIANTLLPMRALTPTQIGIYKRQISPGLPVLANHVVTALRTAERGEIQFPVRPEHVQDLMKKRGIYGGYRLLGMQMINIGMDQRQVSGAFLVFMIDRVIGALDRRFRDPNLPQAKKDKLLDDFAPALVELDEVLRNPVRRKEELAAKREAAAQKTADAQAEALMAEVAMRLRHNLVVPREMLFAAALRHQRKQQQQPGSGVLSDTPAVNVPPGPRTPRRIIE
jgi:hypothetical protein